MCCNTTLALYDQWRGASARTPLRRPARARRGKRRPRAHGVTEHSPGTCLAEAYDDERMIIMA